MPKLSVLLSFLSVLLVTMGGSHAFVWWRLVRQTELSTTGSVVATVVFILGLMAIPLAMALGRQLPAGTAQTPLWCAYVWFGCFFYLFLATLATTLVQAGLRALPQGVLPEVLAQAPVLWWTRTAAVTALALALGATTAALVGVARGPYVTRTEVYLAKLPAALDGLKLVQISDLHVAALLRRPYVEKVVATTAALGADILVFTGDLVDGTVDNLAADIAPLARLRAPLGIYAITGNHEYYSGADAWLAHFRSLGMQPLRNARVTLSKDGARIDLAGIDDWTAHSFGHGHGADLPRALSGRDPSRCLLLLAHQPRAAAEAERAGVDLMLSGHTHGGQIWPFGYAVRLVQPFLQGLSRTGGLQVYVNRGTGYWGPPMRLGAPAEISLLTLRRGSAPGAAPAATP